MSYETNIVNVWLLLILHEKKKQQKKGGKGKGKRRPMFMLMMLPINSRILARLLCWVDDPLNVNACCQE